MGKSKGRANHVLEATWLIGALSEFLTRIQFTFQRRCSRRTRQAPQHYRYQPLMRAREELRVGLERLETYVAVDTPLLKVIGRGGRVGGGVGVSAA